MPAGTLDGGHELYRARVPLIRRRPLWRGLPSATRGPALAPCIRRRRRSPVHQFPYVGPNRMGKRASPTDPTGISRGHALFWGYPVKSILPLTRTGNLPGDYDITHHAVETVVRKFVQKRRTHRFDGFAFSLGFHFLDNAKNLHMTSTGRFIVLY